MTEWREATIAELASPEPNALATGPFGSAISSKHFLNVGVPVLRGSNLSLAVGVRLKDQGLAFLDEQKAATFQRSIARRGDLVFTCWGSIGQVGLIDDRARFEEYVVSNKQMKLTPNPAKADCLFLYYLLSSPPLIQEVQGQAIGAAVPGFNLGQLRQLRIRLPSVQTQRTIATVLGSIDDLIENNRRRIELLEQMAQAIYREWFVHFRYPGHEDVPVADYPLGSIPEGWCELPLLSVANITMGQSPPSKYYNDEHVGRPFHQGVGSFGQHFPHHRKFCSVEGRGAVRGDILVSARAPVGRLNVTDRAITIGRGLAALHSRSGQQELLLQKLRHVFVEEDAMGGGTIFKAIGKRELEQLPIIMAPDSLERDAQHTIEPLSSLLRDLTFSNRLLGEIRDLLLPKLVTGQIDVSKMDVDGLLESVA